jgi:hypothetical protein
MRSGESEIFPVREKILNREVFRCLGPPHSHSMVLGGLELMS